MLNIAVLGCGMVGKMIPPILRQAGEEIDIIFGETKAEADGLVEVLRLQGRGIFTGSYKDDFKRVIDRAGDIDVLYIGTPNFLHEEPLVFAADSGIHIFCEKPLAPSIDAVLNMQRAINRNKVLFEVDSAYGNHELPEQIQAEIAENKLGRILYAEVIYDQDWQKLVDAVIGWRPEIAIAGIGKLIPDLGFHGIYTLMKLTGGIVESIDGRAFNVHPVRYKLKEGVKVDSFGGKGAPRQSEKPDLYEEMPMLGPLPPGMTMDQIVAGYDPRLFTGKYSGDDIGEAHMMVSKEGYKFPVYMRLSQVLKGKNEFTVKIICENGSYEWKQPDPNHMFREEGDAENIIHRNSPPGIFTLPGDHPAGYKTGVGLKAVPYLDKIRARKAGQVTDDEVRAWNDEIFGRALRTQSVLDQWLKLQPGWQEVNYRAA